MPDGWTRPRLVGQPEPGFFDLRLVKDGPLVPARIACDDGMWRAWIDGEPCGPAHPDPVYAAGVYRVWHSGQRADELTYLFRLELRAWARRHDPGHWAANPDKPVRLAERPSLF